MQEHLTRLKAASTTVTELVNRAEQAPDPPRPGRGAVRTGRGGPGAESRLCGAGPHAPSFGPA